MKIQVKMTPETTGNGILSNPKFFQEIKNDRNDKFMQLFENRRFKYLITFLFHLNSTAVEENVGITTCTKLLPTKPNETVTYWYTG